MSTICHVGYTQSLDDMERVMQVSHWCRENAIKYPKKPVFLDLNKRQDFLKMKDTYDMVVLHFICRWEKQYAEQAIKQLRKMDGVNVVRPHTLMVSPLANWGNWRNRLMGTNAENIFLFGGMGEVGGTYIATLDGYKGEKLWDDDGDVKRELWRFKKENNGN